MKEPFKDDALADQLERALTPVKPPEVFRDHLRQNLKLASRQQAARRGYHRPFDWANWWLAMALILGSIGATSLLAYLLRFRSPLFRPPA